MTYARQVERNTRSAPPERFNGGYVGHGDIRPMEEPAWWQRLLGVMK